MTSTKTGLCHVPRPVIIALDFACAASLSTTIP